jgi:hypothetical protein
MPLPAAPDFRVGALKNISGELLPMQAEWQTRLSKVRKQRKQSIDNGVKVRKAMKRIQPIFCRMQ